MNPCVAPYVPRCVVNLFPDTPMAYLTTRPIDKLYPLSVNFSPHPLLSTIPAKSESSGQITYYMFFFFM
jgi:hypothetical protein